MKSTFRVKLVISLKCYFYNIYKCTVYLTIAAHQNMLRIILEGIVLRDGDWYFFDRLLIQISTFWTSAAMVFKFWDALLCRQLNFRFLRVLWKHLIGKSLLKPFSESLLRLSDTRLWLLTTVLKAACDPENYFESRRWDVHFCGFFQHPVRGKHWRKSTNSRKGSQNRTFDAAFGKIFRISQCFHRRKQNHCKD